MGSAGTSCVPVTVMSVRVVVQPWCQAAGVTLKVQQQKVTLFILCGTLTYDGTSKSKHSCEPSYLLLLSWQLVRSSLF